MRLIYRFIVIVILITYFIFPSSSLALIGLEEGDPPVKVMLADMQGNITNLNDYFGKNPVIIAFWELTSDKSFLNYSLDELIFLNGIYERYKTQYGLEIFTIYTPENADTVTADELSRVRNLLKINNIKLPVLIDRGLKIFSDYGVIALPSTVMVGKEGIIQFIYPSFPLTTSAVFDEKIKALLGLAPVHEEHMMSKKSDVAKSVRLYQYALQMFKKGLVEQALSPLMKSLELDQGFADAHNLMGIIYREQGDFEGAVKEFRKATDLDSKSTGSRFNFALMMLEGEKYVDAEAMLVETLAIDNQLAKAHYALGILYKNINRNEEAIRELGKALELFERSKSVKSYRISDSTVFNRISTLYVLSDLLRIKGNETQSRDLLNKAAEIALGLDMKKDRGLMHRSKELLIYE